MEGKQNISVYRDRLDKTLMCSDLSDVESLKILVENQMSKSSEYGDQEYRHHLVEKRSKEVANFLTMLKSASTKAIEGAKANEMAHGGWKIKHDDEECRVMYREGPLGTPLHTLLVEGYVDGPLDVCLCISWEAGLYRKWWPQFNIPTFKVITSKCVKKVRLGEEISLVRMKLSWPLSMREALVHYVLLEYLQDDLVIVLLNSISETENIDEKTHGFTKDGIPDVENVMRIDIVGGLVIQKVSTNRSYFRTIANLDVKLDFLPPSIINFVSRQLIGSGFKLYKKEVASVSKGDADFSKVLKEPLYSQIHEALYPEDKVLEQKEVKTSHVGLEHSTPRSVCEIEEVEEIEKPSENNKVTNDCRVIASPEVNEALATLQKVVCIFRELRSNSRSLSFSRFVNNLFDHNHSKRFVAPTNDLTMRTSQESRSSEVGHGGTETQEDHVASRTSFSFIVNEATLAEKNTNGNEELKHSDESGLSKKKMKKQMFCCLNFNSGGMVS